MKSAFQKMFWGFLFVVLEIHIIVIDILPDPIGYIMIYSGLSYFVDEYKIGRNAKVLTMVLVIFSIPSTFISLNIVNEAAQFLSFWSIYHTLLGLIKLLLVFYIFQVLIMIAKNRANKGFYNYTKNFFIVYMIIMLAGYIITPFGMNFHSDMISWLMIIIDIVGFVIEIMFLVLIFRYKRLR